jgi:uncharacterized protein YbjQ (UPF0145 family)
MPWFHRDSPEEKQQKEAAEAAKRLEADLEEKSRQAILAGGLPLRAQERVAGIRQALSTGAGVPLYSSNLSVNELLLARQTGYEPVGLVAGSCIYHIGWNRWTFTGELDAQTTAMFNAGNLAIDRLRQEARGMGALGVVGVKLEIRRPDWGERLIEVVALGTAIRAHGAGAAPEPFICGLSAQEYFSLLKVGSRPVGFVFGNSMYYIYTDWGDARRNMSWFNQEVVKYSQSVYEAQRFAFGRMHAGASEAHAQGVVGVHFEHTLHKIPYTDSDGGTDEARADYVIEYVAWGTAIVEAPAQIQVPRPSMMLNLEDLARTARFTPGAERGEIR